VPKMIFAGMTGKQREGVRIGGGMCSLLCGSN